MAQDGQKLPAVKIFVSQLDNAVKPLDGVGEGNMAGFVLRDVPFARVWLQGTVVDTDSNSRMFLVDDGTGTITVTMSDAASPQRGQYLLLVGAVEVLTSGHEGRMKGTCDRYRLLCDVIKMVIQLLLLCRQQGEELHGETYGMRNRRRNIYAFPEL